MLSANYGNHEANVNYQEKKLLSSKIEGESQKKKSKHDNRKIRDIIMMILS
jgi:hypothetical protein